MLSVSKVSEGQASSYYKKDSYYVPNEDYGLWVGQGADELGLSGNVSHDSFTEIVQGNDPSTQQKLVQQRLNSKRVPGLDLTFSAPKGVSLLGVIDKEIVKAHNDAVAQTLKYVESSLIGTRVMGENGIRETVLTSNMVAALFQHNFSRELDPQLHTHSFVANMTQIGDKWQSINMMPLLNAKMFLGQMYRTELANRLKTLGYSVEMDHKGLFDIKGVNEEAIELFSKRKSQIDVLYKELRDKYPLMEDSKLREMAALGSRSPKKEVSMDTMKSTWDRELSGIGLSFESLQKSARKEAAKNNSLLKRIFSRSSRPASPHEYITLATSLITEGESTFTKGDALRIAMSMSGGNHNYATIEKAFDDKTDGGSIILVHPSKGEYSTKEMYDTEKAIASSLHEGKGASFSLTDRDTATLYVENCHPHLTDGQKAMAVALLSSSDQFFAFQGDAGVGKTTVLAVLRQFVEHSELHSFAQSLAASHNREAHDRVKSAANQFSSRFPAPPPIRGLGYTGKASNEIINGAGIDSTTIHSFLNSFEKAMADPNKPYLKPFLTKNQIIIVDESSMTGSFQLKELIDAAHKTASKIFFVGDTKQLPAITAGKMFSEMLDRQIVNNVTLNEEKRQTTSWYKSAVTDLKEGRVMEAFSTLHANNAFVTVDSATPPDKRIPFLVDRAVDYLIDNDPKKTLLVTPLNENRIAINNAARKALKEKGVLPDKDHHITVSLPRPTPTHETYSSRSFPVGAYVTPHQSVKGLAAFNNYKVVKHTDEYTIRLRHVDTGKTATVDLLREGSKLSTFEKSIQGFAAGDKIVFLLNDRAGSKVLNGTMGVIEKITDKGIFHISAPDISRTPIAIDPSQYSHITHAYAVTSFKSQGATSTNVGLFYPATSRHTINFQEGYVGVTRGRDNVKIFTDDPVALANSISKKTEKRSTLSLSPKSRDITPSSSFGLPHTARKTAATDKVQEFLIASHPRYHKYSERFLNPDGTVKTTLPPNERKNRTEQFKRMLNDVRRKHPKYFPPTVDPYKKSRTMENPLDKEKRKVDPYIEHINDIKRASIKRESERVLDRKMDAHEQHIRFQKKSTARTTAFTKQRERGKGK